MTLMFKSNRYKPLLHLNTIISLTFHSPFSLKLFTTTTSQPHSHSFTASYLINNLGFTPETATRASQRHRFKSSEKPDSVLVFFRSHGFSDSQVSSIVRRSPRLLSCKPHKTFLPKFQFLASKGVDVVQAVNRNPRFLMISLENNIIPMYGLVRTFFDSDKRAVECLISLSDLLGKKKRVIQGLELLRDEGMSESNISVLIRMRAYALYANGLKEALDEVKELGFHPSKVIFVVALIAKVVLSKTKWNAKVDAFKRWGWSEEAAADAFRKHPYCMMASIEKINLVMSFWVNQLGWNSLDLAIYPSFFGFSLEKRIIPRAFVIHYLLSKGLLKKQAIVTPFALSEKLFLQKYVNNFKEENSQLLKLYQGGILQKYVKNFKEENSQLLKLYQGGKKFEVSQK